MESDNTQTIRDSDEIERFIEALCQLPEIRLQFSSSEQTYPATLSEADEQKLRVDLSATPEAIDHIEKSEFFQLAAQIHGALVHTPFMRTSTTTALQFDIDYPDSLTTVRRRDTFRAPMSHNMLAQVELTTKRGEKITGQLQNLSVGGCLVKLPLMAAAQIADIRESVSLAVQFPNEAQFMAQAEIRHLEKDDNWQYTNAGCEFSDSEQNIAYFVREIERHAARRADRYGQWLEPSDLFTVEEAQTFEIDPTPDAALSIIAAFLKEQMARLTRSDPIEVDKLFIYSQTILNQLRRDRQAFLLALTRATGQPLIVQHSFCVATRLADIVFQDYTKEEVRAITGCALIHDLGKALLPSDLADMRSPFGPKEHATMHTHVSRLIKHLPETNKLPAAIVTQVIGMANERLDGSGYPQQSQKSDLPALARTMAVVDVVDAMQRPRPDRAGWSLTKIYGYLLSNDEQFDNRSIQRYIRRFGKTPVGTLAHYSSGYLGWIQRLDTLGEPVQVFLVMQLGTKNKYINQIVKGGDNISKLGRLVTLVSPEDYDLSPTDNNEQTSAE